MNDLKYCYHCGTPVKNAEEMLGEPQYYCDHCGTRLKLYQPFAAIDQWMDDLTLDETRVVDEIEREMDAGYVIKHNQLFEKFLIPEKRWRIEYFHSEFDKQFDRLKLPDQQQFKSYVKQLAKLDTPALHKAVKQLPCRTKTYRLRVSCDVRAIFRFREQKNQRKIRFILLGKHDHIYGLYKQKIIASIQKTDKYCSLCGHEIYKQNLKTWIDELDPDQDEGKVLERVEREIDQGDYLTHERLFGNSPSLREQPLRWDIKYGSDWNGLDLFKKLYIQDQKRFLAYVEELVLEENPLDHSAVKELTNRCESYRLKISPFVRVIFTLERTDDRQYIRFLKFGKKEDDVTTVNDNLWQKSSTFDYCLKCGQFYPSEDHSWMDVIEPGLGDYLIDLREHDRKNPGERKSWEELKAKLQKEWEEEDQESKE